MNEEVRPHEPTPEDRAIEEALSELGAATGSWMRLLRGNGRADAALVRQYTELLGLLPYELSPETPPAAVKQQLMARLAGGEQPSGDGSRGEIPAVVPMVAVPPAAAAPAMVPAPGSSPWRIYALAAMLALCLSGLGLLSSRVGQQSRELDRLHAQLAVVSVPAPEVAEVARLQQDLSKVRDRLNMVTTVARQAYPLHRVASSRVALSQAAAAPKGAVYVCGQHQQWYLNLQGLEPPPPGAEYHLWFMTEAGKRDGGVLEVRSDRSSEREDLSMPEGTHGFAVTLDRIGPQAQPESLTILLGERAINL